MRHSKTVFGLLGLAGSFALVSALSAPLSTGAFVPNGDHLGLGQRDFRVFNNFTDSQANNNTTADPDFPGVTGAVQAIWKGHLEWASEWYLLIGDQDPTQTKLGTGAANFDNSFQGTVANFGSANSNVHEEEFDPNPGSTLAYTLGPTSDGWIVRYLSGWTWQDGPGDNNATDLQGVATHEIGHTLGLGHSADTQATMYFAISGDGVAARSINTDDTAGVRDIYGDKAANKPIITGLSGSTAIGGTLTISGLNFTATDNVIWFTKANSDGDPVKVTGVASTGGGTTINVTIPTGVQDGSVLVKANFVGDASLSNEWAIDFGGVVTDPPDLVSVTPNTGGFGGWTNVTLGGTGFTGTTSVTFGGTPAQSFVVNSNTQISAVTPPGPNGSAVNVVVTDNDGSDTLVSGFTYTSNPVPDIASVVPNSGPAVGGTPVTISGTTVVGVNSVTFGGVAGTGLSVLNGTTLQVTTPPGLGTVNVVASNASGSDTLVGGWSYVPAGAFVNIGASGIPGQFGEPSLTGSGDLTPGVLPGCVLSLTNAQPFDLAYLFLSAEPTTPFSPFFGGTFYPLPILYQDVLGTDGSGSLVIPLVLPASILSGTQLVLQYFFQDTFAVFGVSGSNGLRLDVP